RETEQRLSRTPVRLGLHVQAHIPCLYVPDTDEPVQVHGHTSEPASIRRKSQLRSMCPFADRRLLFAGSHVPKSNHHLTTSRPGPYARRFLARSDGMLQGGRQGLAVRRKGHRQDIIARRGESAPRSQSRQIPQRRAAAAARNQRFAVGRKRGSLAMREKFGGGPQFFAGIRIPDAHAVAGGYDRLAVRGEGDKWNGGASNRPGAGMSPEVVLFFWRRKVDQTNRLPRTPGQPAAVRRECGV